MMPEGARPPLEAATISPQATGGPDDYGYTWDDSVPLSWIDATTGTDTGMSGSSDGQKVGPISLPFPFKYYENTYNSLYIAASGYLAFTDEGTWRSQPKVPSSAKPNNIIAPYATQLDLATSGPANRVYYASGGTAPNRYFVVEWYQVVHNDETYTYEVVLHENGDIVFQYEAMTYEGPYACGAAGIEDSTGLDGLTYVDLCRRAPSNKAVRFYRPTPTARVKVYPLYQGRFTRAGETAAFQVSIRNNGDLGVDTYDLSVLSAWPTSLYAADGTTHLTDTDGDGAVDTGPVAQGATVTVTAKVQTPAGVNVGDHNSATLTVHSSLDSNRSKTATLQTAIPAPFAQVYMDAADGAMSLYLAQPGAQALKKTTPDRYDGSSPAIAEMPNSNGFAYFWTRNRSVGNVYACEIEYTLLDRYGDTTRGVSKLTNHSGATMYTCDFGPAVAVAPNGRIGVLWYRRLWNPSTSQSNHNIWFAILDAAGNLVYGPLNLTNNNTWSTWSDYGVPSFYNPRIAATADNRFVLAWERQSQESTGRLSDVYYAVRDASGAEVKGVIQLTTNGDSLLHSANAVSGNGAIFTWLHDWDIYYAVVSSAGNVVKGETKLTNNGQGRWDSDAVALPDGKTVVAWINYDYSLPVDQLAFAVLDRSYNRIAGPTALNNLAATKDVSIAADAAGHAVLTWRDSYHRNLYYALVDGSGNVLTPPMIFRTAGISLSGDQYIETSYRGYGNTSYSWTPPSGVDGVAAFGASLFGGPPGGNAAVSLRYANHGVATASGVVLTATLDSNLTYVSDSSGISPTVSGNDVIWSLPDVGFLDSRGFVLYVQVPSGAAYGTRYSVTLTLTSDGPEANAADNIDNAEVMVARQVLLPLVFRGY